MSAKAGRQRPRPPEANTVIPYDPSWPQLFQRIHERLAPAFVGTGATIEHVGSTAVPGLAAKPIIDLDVVVPSEPEVRDALDRLRGLGYVHRGDLGIPGREAFDVPPELPYHHLYVVVRGSKPHQDHVLLRDDLRRNPPAAERYGRRKQELARLITAESRQQYLEAKAGLIEELLRDARRGRR